MRICQSDLRGDVSYVSEVLSAVFEAKFLFFGDFVLTLLILSSKVCCEVELLPGVVSGLSPVLNNSSSSFFCYIYFVKIEFITIGINFITATT